MARISGIFRRYLERQAIALESAKSRFQRPSLLLDQEPELFRDFFRYRRESRYDDGKESDGASSSGPIAAIQPTSQDV